MNQGGSYCYMNQKRMNVGYLRVSTEEQTKGFSIPNQELTVLRSADTIGMKIDKFYIDEGRSAFKKHVYRKSFEELISDVKADKIAVIFVWKLDRLIRNNIKNEELFLLFEKHGVKVISVTENHLDFSTADGRANIRRKGVENQYESERTSERVIGSAKTSAEMGNYPKGRVPLGYKRIHLEYGSAPLELDPDVAPKVKYIFEKIYKEKIGCWKLLSWLNSEKYLGIQWKEEYLYSMLKNEIYIGTYVNNLRNPTFKVKNHTPKLVDEEIFYGVQKLIKSRFKPHKYKYHFKGFVKCAGCGSIMKAKSAKNGRSKKAYLYYFCSACKCRVNHDELDRKVAPSINVKLIEKEDMNEIGNINEWQRKLKSIEYLIAENEKLFVDGVINLEYYNSRSEDYLKQRFKINDEISKSNENIGRYIMWSELDYSRKREVLKNYISCIHIYDPSSRNLSIKIEFNTEI